MVHWIWIVVALFAGAMVGMLASALCVMASGDSIEDQIDDETCCGTCKPGRTD